VVLVFQAGFPVDCSKERQAWEFSIEATAFCRLGQISAMENDGRIIRFAASQRQHEIGLEV
jgi:hypothetical protein